MYFADPYGFWLFLILLVILPIFIYAIRRLAKFNNKDFLVYSNVPTWRRRLFSLSLYTLALISCLFAFTQPYIYLPQRVKQYSDIRILFVVDVSRSMVFAEDVSPNRLEAVKKHIKEFYNSLDGNYECAILPFAGDANPYYCPFTTGRNTFLSMLDELNSQSVPVLGTDLTRAIKSIQEVYIAQDKIDKSGFNIVILLSDGGKEEALATNKIELLKLTSELSNKNFKVYTIGVGGSEPTPLIRRDSKGNFIGYITGEDKQVATSQLDEEILQQVAENGNGQYYGLNSSSTLTYDLQQIIKENRKLADEKVELKKYNLQQYLFSVTVCLLVICLLLNKV